MQRRFVRSKWISQSAHRHHGTRVRIRTRFSPACLRGEVRPGRVSGLSFRLPDLWGQSWRTAATGRPQAAYPGLEGRYRARQVNIGYKRGKNRAMGDIIQCRACDRLRCKKPKYRCHQHSSSLCRFIYDTQKIWDKIYPASYTTRHT